MSTTKAKAARPLHPTSANALIAELNALIYETFPPKWRNGSWAYGRLYYLGNQAVDVGYTTRIDYTFQRWMLDGITPVGIDCVLDLLEQAGRDVSRYRTQSPTKDAQ